MDGAGEAASALGNGAGEVASTAGNAAGEVASTAGNVAQAAADAAAEAINSPAGQIVTGVATGVACMGGPELCFTAALVNANLHVDSDIVHAVIHHEAMSTLTVHAVEDVVSAGISALPSGLVDKELYDSLVSRGGGKYAYYQLQAISSSMSTMLGVAWANVGC